jgi:hypothetical protein
MGSLFSHRRSVTCVCLAFAIVCALSGSAAAQNLLVNGSFENGYTGWTATGNQLIATNDGSHPASDGTSVVVLNPALTVADAVLSQTFTTTPNQRYLLSFDFGRVGGVIDGRLHVTIQGASVLFDQITEVTAPTTAAFYVPQRYSFVADSASTTISFTDISISPFLVDSLLDNMQVVAVPAGVPVITAPPQRAAVMQGRNASFSVTATGSGTLAYQWRFNGVDIAGATASTLTISPATLSNVGSYSVRVSNASGSITSSDVTLLALPTAILLNGSFEFGTAAWQLNDVAKVYTTLNPDYTFSDGVQLMHFNYGQGPTGGSISQSIPTASGAQYNLSFDMGAHSTLNSNEQRMRVLVQGTGQSTLLDQTFSVFAAANGTHYVSQAVTFVADGPATTLTFIDVSATTLDIDLVLDHVIVTQPGGGLPVITSQPQSQTVPVGNSVSFSVAATGVAPLTYQWRFNGAPISNAIGSTYAIATAQPSQAGSYDVIVSNPNGPTTSAAATLTVTGGAPPFTNGSFEADFQGWTTSGKVDIETFAGVATDGVKAVSFNGGQQPPNGLLTQTFATTAGQTYTLSFDAGAISGVNQDEQRMQVTVLGTTTLASKLVSVFAPGNGVQYVGQTMTFVADGPSATLSFQDVSATTLDVDLLLDNVRVTALVAGAFTNGSFEADFQGWTTSGKVDIENFAGVATDGVKAVSFNGGQQPPSGILSQTFATTFGQTYTVTFDAGAISGINQDEQRMQVTVQGKTTLASKLVSVFAPGNGVKYVGQTMTFVADGPQATLSFQDMSATTLNVDLLLDNVRLSGGSGAPVITAQPQSLTVSVGSPASFSVTATGAAPLTYQWWFNGTAIGGATTSTFTIASAQAGNAGSYAVIVSNPGGATTSAVATLTVSTTGPQSFTNGSFEADFLGWTTSGKVDIESFAGVATDGVKAVSFNGGQQAPNGVLTQTFATTSGQTYTLTFDAGAISGLNQDEQRMQVTVQGNTTLATKLVSVFAPGNGVKYVGQTMTFVADGPQATLSFQDMSATTLNVDLLLDNVRLSNSAAPVITAQPQNQTVTVGSPASFSVTATGAPTLTYQWRFNASPIGGATNSSYTIASAQTTNAGNYDVVVSNGGGSTTSAVAILTVSTTGPQPFTNGSFEADFQGWTTSGKVDIENFAGVATDGVKAVSFNGGQQAPNGVLTQTFATTSGQTYTLTFDAGAISGLNQDEQRMQVTVQGTTTLASKLVSVFAPGNGVKYVGQTMTFVADGPQATLSFQDMSATTLNVDLLLDNVRLSSSSGPVITAQPQNLTVTVGSPASFSVTATGAAPITYQWRFGGSPIGGATNSTYTIASAQASNAGNYDVVVSNPGGPTTSAIATLTVNTTGPQPFTNGSFESDFQGWTTSGKVDIETFAGVATDGVKAVSFNGGQQTPNGVLTQTFATTQGQSYTLTFDAGAISGVNQDEQRMQVTVLGSTTLASKLVSVFAPGNGVRYVGQTMIFVADGPSATLSFQDMSATTLNVDLLLDNVRLATTTSSQGVSNGSFESDYAGWFSSGNQAIATSDPGHPASQGSKVVVFNGNNLTANGVLSQTFPTVQGQRYALTFDLGTIGAVADQRLEVALQGSSLLYDQIHTVSAPSSALYYSTQHVTFVADSLATTLTFTDQSITYFFIDMLLDNVQVTPENAQAPIVTAQPQKTFAVQAGSASFSVTASGAGPLTYQWLFNGGVIPGATNSTYSLSGATAGNAGNYSVVVSNASGSVTSSQASLIILPPSILLNGSFEFGSAAWTFSNFLDVSVSTNTTYGVSDGAQLVHFNFAQRPPAGVLSQTFTTTPGQTYTLAFDLGAFSNGNQAEQRIQVQLQGNAQLLSQTVSVFAPGSGGAYVPQSFSFVADSTSTTLTFTDVSPTTLDVDLLLDNVRVTSPTTGAFTNGSFEAGFQGWTTSGKVDIENFAGVATDGVQAVSFNGGQQAPNGVLSQTFTTTPGQSYTLTFDAGAISGLNQDEQRMQVTVQGTTTLASKLVSVFAPGNGVKYVPQTMTFVADGAQVTLTFQDMSATTLNVDLLLDNVRITP